MAGLCAPCRRFADILAEFDARLGADVVRYSFIVVDLHHLLLAGLPAHSVRGQQNPRRRFSRMSHLADDRRFGPRNCDIHRPNEIRARGLLPVQWTPT